MWHVPRAPLFDVNVFTLMALVIVLQVHLVSLDLGGGRVSHGWVTWLTQLNHVGSGVTLFFGLQHMNVKKKNALQKLTWTRRTYS